MPPLDKLKAKLSKLDMSKTDRIRDSIILALKRITVEVTIDYLVTITVTGKINETGFVINYELGKEQILNFIEQHDESGEKDEKIEKISHKAAEKLEKISINAMNSGFFKDMETSIGVNIPNIGEITIVVRIERLNV
jgi:hypothetical protein